jgi:tRNA(Ile)-lysidine synthase
MQEKLIHHLQENFSFLQDKKLLLAVSGGLDSMVLLKIFQMLHFEIGVAHCNFKLRDEESDADAVFVENQTKNLNIPFFSTSFETKHFAALHKTSIQIAARKLRYDWFYQLLEIHKFDYILTAHHADDAIETFIINLTRGTGLEGFIGIPAQNNKVIRPLLTFSRVEIEDYAKKINLKWREDSSNNSDKYIRNKIRLDVMPILKSINPNFVASFQKTQQYLQQSHSLVKDSIQDFYKKVVTVQNDSIYFDLDELLKKPNYRAYLYQWLKEYGFEAWDDIYKLPMAQTGKQVFTTDYSLLKNRKHLILSPLKTKENQVIFEIKDISKNVNFPIKLSFCKVNDVLIASNTTIFVDEEKLNLPLVLRRWQEGDFFQPNGMNSKSKKISKFFKDIKLPLLEKQNVWLLCHNNQIVWVVGFRQDERFKANKNTKKILQIQFLL